MPTSLIVRSGYSSNLSEIGAAAELKEQLGEAPGGTLFFFASGAYKQSTLNGALLAMFPDWQLIGLATQGAFAGPGFYSTGISALHLPSDDFHVTAHVAENVSENPFDSPKHAVIRAFDDLAIDPLDLDVKRTIGILLDGGTPAKREFMLAGITEIAPWLTMTGLGAPFVPFLLHSPAQVGVVHLGDQVVTDAALFALIHTDHPWRIMRLHPYRPTGRSVRITRSSPRKFLLDELNQRSAVEELTFLLDGNLRQSRFTAPNGTLEYPLGIKVGREHFIRAVARFSEEGQLQTIGSMLPEGLTMDLMAPEETESPVDAFLAEVSRKLGSLRGALVFGSYHHVLGKEAAHPFERAFAGVPTAGGAGIYQLHNGLNLSHTLTVLGFGA